MIKTKSPVLLVGDAFKLGDSTFIITKLLNDDLTTNCVELRDYSHGYGTHIIAARFWFNTCKKIFLTKEHLDRIAKIGYVDNLTYLELCTRLEEDNNVSQ